MRPVPAPSWMLLFILPVVLALSPCSAGAATVACTVDATAPRQVIEGFGCTWLSEVFGTSDTLTSSQRSRVVDALFNQIKIRLGQSQTLFEAPQSAGAGFFGQRANDNNDPAVISWSGFNTYIADQFKAGISDRAPTGMENRIYPGILLNSRWSSPWLATWFTTAGKQRALDECAEQALATVTWWTTTYGAEPRWAHLTNEPFSGNGELAGMPESWAPDLVKTCGARLRAAGFNTVKFIVSSDETEEKSLAVAQSILGDNAAASYVAAIGYHTYPYGSTYAKAANILATSGSGAPAASRIQVRSKLRDLAASKGIQCWMTEVSHSELDATDFEALRARAIHIHDEFQYANASSYFGMNSSWSRTADILHFGGNGDSFRSDSDSLVLTDQTSDQVFITSMGYAIGHYARWLTAGQAIRLEASSGDALVQISSFHDTAQNRLVTVLINNATTDRQVALTAAGLNFTGQVSGERSTAAAFWASLPAFAPSSSNSITLALPMRSVTTISVALGGTAPIAPTIATPPTNQTVTAGQTATFTVNAGGTAPLTYQWKRGTANVGSNSATLTIANAQSANAGTYTVTISNSAGATVSGAVTLTVNDAAVAPTITTQPVDMTVTAGQTASFAVVAAGTGPLTYLWKMGTTNVGTNSGTLTITNTQATNAGSYTCVVTNGAGSATSSAATLTVNAVVDTTPPATPGSPTTSDAASSTPTLSGTTEAGATVRIYDNGALMETMVANGSGQWSWTVAPPLTAGAHQITVTATDSSGNTSAASSATTVTVAGGTTLPPIPSSESGGGGKCGLGSAIAVFSLALMALMALITMRADGRSHRGEG